jgi:hypothetical protein
MRLSNITLAGIILLMLAFTTGMAGATEQNVTGNTSNATATAATVDDQAVDNSLIGPGNALYGLKIAFENIGETFTFNASEKLGLQVAHARQRIAEVRAALKRNDTEAANKALDEYKAKLNSINESVSKLSDKDGEVLNAQDMILKHQLILENLSISHPNNSGLQRAYNNSMDLETKIASKIEQKHDVENLTVTGASVKEKKSRK